MDRKGRKRKVFKNKYIYSKIQSVEGYATSFNNKISTDVRLNTKYGYELYINNFEPFLRDYLKENIIKIYYLIMESIRNIKRFVIKNIIFYKDNNKSNRISDSICNKNDLFMNIVIR